MFSCSLTTLSAGERIVQPEIWRDLLQLAQRTELDDGYSFAFDPTVLSIERVARLMDMESRCCAFALMELTVTAGRKATFQFKGPNGTKEILMAQLAAFTEGMASIPESAALDQCSGMDSATAPAKGPISRK